MGGPSFGKYYLSHEPEVGPPGRSTEYERALADERERYSLHWGDSYDCEDDFARAEPYNHAIETWRERKAEEKRAAEARKEAELRLERICWQNGVDWPVPDHVDIEEALRWTRHKDVACEILTPWKVQAVTEKGVMANDVWFPRTQTFKTSEGKFWISRWIAHSKGLIREDGTPVFYPAKKTEYVSELRIVGHAWLSDLGLGVMYLPSEAEKALDRVRVIRRKGCKMLTNNTFAPEKPSQKIWVQVVELTARQG